VSVKPVIHVVDDEPVILKTMVALLSSVGHIVRTYAGADEFLAAYRDDAPGCLITDIRMPGRSGLQLQAELAARRIDLPVIVMSSFPEIEVAVQAMRLGAVHFLQKPFSRQAMLDEVGVRVAHHSKTWAERQKNNGAAAMLQSLTPREREIADLLLEGKSSKEIARILAISNRTVDAHRARILAKFGARSALELVRMLRAAIDAGPSAK
jgi:FixJ family two-component response regulator